MDSHVVELLYELQGRRVFLPGRLRGGGIEKGIRSLTHVPGCHQPSITICHCVLRGEEGVASEWCMNEIISEVSDRVSDILSSYGTSSVVGG
jgi:hypothetical protein